MEDTVPRRSQGVAAVVEDGEEEEEADFEFEFPFVGGADGAGSHALADDLFADGRIRPFYPVFGRGRTGGCGGGTASVVADVPAVALRRTRGQLGRLFLEESRERSASSGSTSSSADDDDLEGVLPESYCVWAPGSRSSASPRVPPRKSSSTGSMARWRRISDLVVGRSHSDRKEKFLFLPANPRPPPPKHQDNPSTKPRPPRPTPAAGGAGSKKPPPTEVGTVAAAHRIAYGANTGGAGTPRRTFLPYREELVGFFANVHHPHPY